MASVRTKVLAPNDPPMGGQMMRTSVSGRPKRPARSWRMLKGVWVPVVTSSLPSCQLAMQAWGSIATCCTAGMRKVSSTITWAASNPSAWSSGSGSAV